MIKFFRHIRKRLISESKFSKYLLYAIGEIILVVIGILIALQINNWNEERKERHQESAILKQVHTDFLSNKLQLDSIKTSNQRSVDGCSKLIKLIPFKKDSATTDSILKYIGEIVRVKTFNPSNGSVESLISSSSFNVIRNDTLRDYLVTWKDVFMDYQEEEQYARDFQIWELLPYIRKNINLLEPYDKVNIAARNTLEFQNFWLQKQQSHVEILESIQDEQVEHYIDEIIRLTKPQSND